MQAAGHQHPQVSSGLIGARRSPDNRPYLPEWQIKPPLFVSFRGAPATQAVMTSKTSY